MFNETIQDTSITFLYTIEAMFKPKLIKPLILWC